jgi:hypothetical protein
LAEFVARFPRSTNVPQARLLQAQAEFKQQIVADQLQRLGRIAKPPVTDIVALADPAATDDSLCHATSEPPRTTYAEPSTSSSDQPSASASRVNPAASRRLAMPATA